MGPHRRRNAGRGRRRRRRRKRLVRETVPLLVYLLHAQRERRAEAAAALDTGVAEDPKDVEDAVAAELDVAKSPGKRRGRKAGKEKGPRGKQSGGQTGAAAVEEQIAATEVHTDGATEPSA